MMIDKAKRIEILKTEGREDCIFCDGRGRSRYSIPSEFKKVSCECCDGEGIINYKCNRCDGTGRYIHPVLKRDVGECRACKGLGFSQQKSGAYEKYLELMRKRKREWNVLQTSLGFVVDDKNKAEKKENKQCLN